MHLVKQGTPKHGARSVLLRVGAPERDEFLDNLFVDLPYVLVGKVQGDATVSGLLQRFDDVV